MEHYLKPGGTLVKPWWNPRGWNPRGTFLKPDRGTLVEPYLKPPRTTLQFWWRGTLPQTTPQPGTLVESGGTLVKPSSNPHSKNLVEPYLKPPQNTPLLQNLVEPWWNPGGTLVEPWWNPGQTLVEPWWNPGGTPGGKREGDHFRTPILDHFRTPMSWIIFEHRVGHFRTHGEGYPAAPVGWGGGWWGSYVRLLLRDRATASWGGGGGGVGQLRSRGWGKGATRRLRVPSYLGFLSQDVLGDLRSLAPVKP